MPSTPAGGGQHQAFGQQQFAPTRARVAPSAARTPSSRWRALRRTSIRFATLAQAASSTSATAACNNHNTFATASVRYCCNPTARVVNPVAAMRVRKSAASAAPGAPRRCRLRAEDGFELRLQLRARGALAQTPDRIGEVEAAHGVGLLPVGECERHPERDVARRERERRRHHADARGTAGR
jgi:hypothetical protein